MAKFQQKLVEEYWINKWEASKLYETPERVLAGEKCYILPQLPYPSGAGLHVGHAEVYTACDIYARFQRMVGKNVLQVIGWDAFGLPAENYAIKTNVHPRINTNKAIDNFRSQIKSLGISVDWDREVGSHNPDYYKWTQWFFLLMLERGLAYRKEQSVNWCDSCKTVLANEQVEDGKCERCGTEVEQKMMEQWYLKITDYAKRLYEDLGKVDWPKETVQRQRNWIGMSEGINITYKVKDTDKTITVFTTRPDTNYGATFVALAPDGNDTKALIDLFPNRKEVEKYIEATKNKTELERMTDKTKSGVFTGLYIINNLNNKEIPVYVSDFVLGTVGTGSLVGVPAHDKRDFEFANKFGIEIARVVELNGDSSPINSIEQVQEDAGTMINSDFLNGLDIHDAKEKIMDYLEAKGWGERVTNFRLRDWSISRQRFWGAPIPIVYNSEGEPIPVAKEDLPVILPDDVDFVPTGQSPLNYSEAFHKGVEEKYGKGWRREVDTLDTFMCSSWYFFRYLDPHNDQAFASEEVLKQWMPVDFYLGGEEHVNGHLLYSRFFTKVLFDAGYIDFDEPFTVHRHQGLILGEDNRKMSKRWGNIINPTEVVEKYGADTIRVYEMFMGPLEHSKAWNDSSVQGVRRFIDRVYKFAINDKYNEDLREDELFVLNSMVKKVSNDTQNLKFNTAISEFMKFVNYIESDGITKGSFITFVKLLAPYAPFVTEEIWGKVWKEKDSIHIEKWPEFDESKIVQNEVIVAVQVNGKLRATLLMKPDSQESDALKLAEAQDNVKKFIEGKQIKKVIYIKDKLLNIVI